MNRLSYYKGKFTCPHCLWVADDERLSSINYKDFVKPFYIIPNKNKFQGLTVIDSHKKLYNTLNCIYGCKDGQNDIYHSYLNLGNIFKGISMFFKYLYDNHNVTQVNILINSNYKEKFGVKEHPHALMTVVEPTDFFKNDENYSKQVIHLAENPFEGDTVFELNSEECNSLVSSGENFKDFILYISKGLINMSTNFYIFLTYSIIDGERHITGKISTDKTVKKL